MKLVFYGGGNERKNALINKAMISLIKKNNPIITFIPACSFDADIEFSWFTEYFKRFHVTKFINFPIDIPYNEILLSEVLKSDIIYLGGGNTYYFLNNLRKGGFITILRNFVANGGILSGLSAGAILMTPTIQTAGFPIFDRDENEEKLKDLKALNLVRFEIFPHYKNSKRYDAELKSYSKKISYPLYACPDSCGVLVNDEKLCFFGRNWCFYKGEKILLRPY